MMTTSEELGAWIGRRQAFGYVAARASASEAICIRTIRNRKLYLIETESWGHFCSLHLGMSRASADRVIHYLEEFGVNYFHLNQLIRIPPQTYRALACYISDDGLSFNGETIPFLLENTARLAAAIEVLHPRNPSAIAPASTPDHFPLVTAALRDAARRLTTLALSPDQKRELHALLQDLTLFT